jgi:uncharacterized protein (TIGR03437 family)
VRVPAFSVAVCLAFSCSLAAQTYSARTLAGTSYNGDGNPATAAILVQPEGIAIDALGSVFIADAGDNRVRKIDTTGRISTLAGVGFGGSSGDGGPASAARINAPYDVCVDNLGNVYVADLGNGRVRRITPDGKISTFAGGGILGADPLNPRPATEVQLIQPRNVAVDARGTVYISDFGANRIYQVTSDGKLTHLAGTGEAGTSEDGLAATRSKLSGPAGIAVDVGGNVYVADSGNQRVKRIYAGTMMTVRDTAGRPVEFATPTSVAIDRSGELHVADGSNIVHHIKLGGEIGFVSFPAKTIAFDSTGKMYAAANGQVQRLDIAIGAHQVISKIAGSGSGGFSGDGRPQSEWRFTGPSGIVRDTAGNIYIADTGNGRIRQISPNKELTTLIAGLSRPAALALDGEGRLYVADAGSGQIHRYERGTLRIFSLGSEGKPFVRPSALAFDKAGNLFVADTGNNLIRKISTSGAVTTAVGGGGNREDTHPLRVKLADPAGIAFDSTGSLWLSEAGSGVVRKLSPSGELTNFKPDLKEPRGIRIDATGALFICETAGHRVVRMMPDGTWFPVAGTGDPGWSDVDGPALESPMIAPVDLWLDSEGRIIVADAGSGRIRELVPVAGSAPRPAPITQSKITVVHAATQLEQEIAPGQLVAIRGKDLIDDGHTLPAETEVTIRGVPAALLAISKMEILAQLPLDLQPGATELKLSHRGAERAAATVNVAAVAPGLFANLNGSGLALALNESGTRNSVSDPAARGSIICLYGTGHGATPVTTASVYVGELEAEVLYAGAAPGQPGVFQINARTPSGFAPSGILPITAIVNGIRSQAGVTLVTH